MLGRVWVLGPNVEDDNLGRIHHDCRQIVRVLSNTKVPTPTIATNPLTISLVALRYRSASGHLLIPTEPQQRCLRAPATIANIILLFLPHGLARATRHCNKPLPEEIVAGIERAHLAMALQYLSKPWQYTTPELNTAWRCTKQFTFAVDE